MNENYNFELFKRIKKKYGTYVRFQKETGIHNNLTSMVVCGWRRPSLELKMKFANALGCDPKDIFPD